MQKNHFWKRLVVITSAAAIVAASCTSRDGQQSVTQAVGPSGGEVTWDGSGNYYFDGQYLGRVDCTDYDDPRIDGSDGDFNAYLDEKCTATVSAPPDPGPEPCDPANMTLTLDGSGYTIDTCVESDGTDPYWDGTADWVQVPEWSNDFDAECWVEDATGNGCCAFYVDIDSSELSDCDVVYSGSGSYTTTTEYGSDTTVIARTRPGQPVRRTITTSALAYYGSGGDPPGNPNPQPPPPPRPDPSRTWSRIGSAVFLFGVALTPISPDIAKPIRDIGARIIKEVDKREQQRRGIQRRAPRGGGIGAPPDPPPGWSRRPFQRGGRRPPPETTRPPEVRPPNGRPITKPGQVSPQPAPRPPYRPR